MKLVDAARSWDNGDPGKRVLTERACWGTGSDLGANYIGVGRM